MSHFVSTVLPRMPLVVQLGFAGSRHLLDTAAYPDVDEGKFHADVFKKLCSVMRELRTTLGLSDGHFLCGLSQIAIGADTIFTQACMELKIQQRIVLPQDPDAYFAAFGTNGERDFTDAEVEKAKDLLCSTHIIEQRVVSTSSDRRERFEDVILELVSMSDVLIALRCKNAFMTSGGTMDLIDRARVRNRPLLEIIVGVEDGLLVFEPKWHWNKPDTSKPGSPDFTPPMLPKVFGKCVMGQKDDYARSLMHVSSRQAEKHQWLFKRSALIIIGAHIGATVCAVTALIMAGMPHKEHDLQCEITLQRLLFGELGLLLGGLLLHLWLHHFHATRRWATARLVTEVARSVNAMTRVTGYLEHLFTLPFPEFLRPLLSTLNIYHLKAQGGLGRDTWAARREAYVGERLTRPQRGQIPYYEEQRRKASLWVGVANWLFYPFGIFALLATFVEVMKECHGSFPAWAGWLNTIPERWPQSPGFLAIILPVLSVAVLSLAASFDLEARERTFDEMLQALKRLQKLIESAKSEHEFVTLVVQTEKRLLGEHVNWFSRRVFTGVT